MFFEPVVVDSIFTEAEISQLKNLLATADNAEKNWIDPKNNRRVLKYRELEEVFSKKLEPLARKIFNEPRIKTTYSVYLDYNKPTSKLPPHKDNNACTYTIDYCVSAKTPWGMFVEDKEYVLLPNQGLFFMGGHDAHWREEMPNPENNRVEVVMFHFCVDNHWYFTHGQDYMYELMEKDMLPEGDSYHLSPSVINKML